jgi:hypothetical protein
MAIAYNTSVVRDGLVFHLDAANPKSYIGTGTNWIDLKNLSNATLQNGVVFNSENKGNFIFDGVNDFVDTGKTASQLGILDTSYTMSAFLKVPNLTGDKMVFGTTEAALRKGMHHGVRDSYFYFGHFSADVGGGSVVANTWYYATWVWSTVSPNARIYVNGILVASSSVGSFIGTTNILIGKWLNISPLTVAQASIYNRALTVQEIQNNFNALRGRYGI